VKVMNRSTICAALLIATISVPLSSPSTWADDAHHPAQGAATQTQTAPQPAPTSAALSEPTIKALQEALSKQGIAVKADGVLSDETRAAIKSYQTQHHLPVTGEPDKATLDKLGVVAVSAAPAQPQTSAQATPMPPPAGSPPTATQPAPQAPTQPGQMPSGMMMMNCPMMQGQMQGMMQMMQTMQGQMQGMMQMMQTMQRQMPPGPAQPGAK
jgi:putative peptidoglycan binding protein